MMIKNVLTIGLVALLTVSCASHEDRYQRTMDEIKCLPNGQRYQTVDEFALGDSGYSLTGNFELRYHGKVVMSGNDTLPLSNLEKINVDDTANYMNIKIDECSASGIRTRTYSFDKNAKNLQPVQAPVQVQAPVMPVAQTYTTQPQVIYLADAMAPTTTTTSSSKVAYLNQDQLNKMISMPAATTQTVQMAPVQYQVAPTTAVNYQTAPVQYQVAPATTTYQSQQPVSYQVTQPSVVSDQYEVQQSFFYNKK